MRKIWNDLQKPITGSELERSEVPMWSSKPSIIGTTFQQRFNDIIKRQEYANYLDKNTILGNILIDITAFEIMFIHSCLNIMKPPSGVILKDISVPEGY